MRRAIEEADAAIKDHALRHPELYPLYKIYGATVEQFTWPKHIEIAGEAPMNEIFLGRPAFDPDTEIEPRYPVGYAYGHPVETVILGTMLTIVSLFTILWVVSQRW